MARNSSDFLQSYFEYAKDDICPEKFHYWTGVSIIAGALERKIWVSRGTYTWFPNLYVTLVAKPAVGKTSAGNVGVDLLQQLSPGDHGKSVRFGPQEMSQAALVDSVGDNQKTFELNGVPHKHSSVYLYAPEASATLSEINGGGKITNTLNTFYDCPKQHTKLLRSGAIPLTNICMNMLACVTFAFLDELLPQAAVGGGFASRLLYVVEDDIPIRRPKWRPERVDKSEIHARLLEDLLRIYEMKGQMRTTEAWERAWEEFYPQNDEEMRTVKSERMQHFLGRRITNTVKLSMVCAAAESDELVLDVRHWRQAQQLITAAEENLPKIVKNTVAKDSSKGIAYHLLKAIQEAGGSVSEAELFGASIRLGIDGQKLNHTLANMTKSGVIIFEGAGVRKRFRLLANPDDYLG